MSRLAKMILAVLWSSVVGFAIGAAIGLLFCPFTFGISLWAGMGFGLISGAAAGFLATADHGRVYEGWGLGIGAAISVVAFVALVTQCLTKPDLSSGPVVFPICGLYAFGVGSLSGRIGERAARQLADSF